MQMNFSGTIFKAGMAWALVLAAALPEARAQNLLAGWTFNNQASQAIALTADEGLLAGTAVLTPKTGGSSATLTLNGDGTIALGPGEVLYCPTINSAQYPALRSGMTIWVSFTATAGTAVNSAVFGLMTATPAATGSTFPANGVGALGYQIASSGVRVTGMLSDNATQFGPGSGYNAFTSGTPISAAVEFSSTGTAYTCLDDTDGSVVSRGPNSTALNLAAFTNFAIGRLVAGGADYTTLTVNEVRIYNGVLTPAQIAALSPTLGAVATAFSFYGVNEHPSWYSDSTDLCNQIIASGAKWARVGMEWADIETSRGTYNAANLAKMDAIVNQLTAAGVNIDWGLGYTPQWASSQPSSPNFRAYAPASWSDWTDFVTFVANRYNGKIAYWEVWNEEDYGFWADTVANYETVLQTAATALRAANPSNKVILGGLATSNASGDNYGLGTFFDTLLADGAGPYIDIVAYHAYGDSLRQVNVYNGMMAVLNKYSLGALPIWITETGLTTNGDDTQEPAKADYSDQLYLMDTQWPNIQKAFWYSFRGTETGNPVEDGYGLVDATGATPGPLPAFYHYDASGGAQTDFGLANAYPTQTPDFRTLYYIPASSGDGSLVTPYNGDPTKEQIPAGKFMYLSVADDWLFQANGGLDANATVTVTYLDQGTGNFSLQYDGAGGAYTSLSHARTNTGQWLTASFPLADAYFGSRENNAADMRLSSGGAALVVSAVAVQKETNMARVILGATDLFKYISHIVDNTVGDEGYDPVATVGGLSCREILGNGSFVYFRVSKALVKPTTTHVNVAITFWDAGTDNLLLQYNGTAGAYEAKTIAKTNTNAWRKVTVNLTDAAFTQTENYSADFRLSNAFDSSVEYIREVDVTLP